MSHDYGLDHGELGEHFLVLTLPPITKDVVSEHTKTEEESILKAQ